MADEFQPERISVVVFELFDASDSDTAPGSPGTLKILEALEPLAKAGSFRLTFDGERMVVCWDLPDGRRGVVRVRRPLAVRVRDFTAVTPHDRPSVRGKGVFVDLNPMAFTLSTGWLEGSVGLSELHESVRWVISVGDSMIEWAGVSWIEHGIDVGDRPEGELLELCLRA